MDILSTVLGQFSNIPPRYSKRQSSVLSLNKAAKLMKVVANKLMSSEQLIETELSKAYLYRALRCKDSDNDSIYCVANVYLAVLYYTRGQYQTAIDHCTLVTRLQDHSQCSSQIVQRELLPKIDDNIDNTLGLTVFYQYVISAALNQQLQRKYVSVFTTAMFAYYLHCRLLSVAKCPLVTSTLHDVGHQWVKCISKMRQLFIGDVLILKSLNIVLNQNVNNKPQWSKRRPSVICENDANTLELVELLQRSAVERLTTFRQFEAQYFGSVVTIVTTDFEALFAYKHGDYQRCLQLSTQNVHTLLAYDVHIHIKDVQIYPEFIQLLDDDIVSLTALSLIVNPECRNRKTNFNSISQLTLSLYLMTQCQLNLRHSVTSLAQTLEYIKLAQKRHPAHKTLDQLTLKLAERKATTYCRLRFTNFYK